MHPTYCRVSHRPSTQTWLDNERLPEIVDCCRSMARPAGLANEGRAVSTQKPFKEGVLVDVVGGFGEVPVEQCALVPTLLPECFLVEMEEDAVPVEAQAGELNIVAFSHQRCDEVVDPSCVVAETCAWFGMQTLHRFDIGLTLFRLRMTPVDEVRSISPCAATGEVVLPAVSHTTSRIKAARLSRLMELLVHEAAIVFVDVVDWLDCVGCRSGKGASRSGRCALDATSHSSAFGAACRRCGRDVYSQADDPAKEYAIDQQQELK